MARYKLAKDLVPGDNVQVTPARGKRPASVTVLSVTPSERVVRTKILHVILRGEDGKDIQHTYNEYTTINLVGEVEP